MIWDVVVDVREGSPTFGTWDTVDLSPENGKGVLLAEGLGHAFMALEEDSVVTYLCTAEYDPLVDFSFSPLSPNLGIPFLEKGLEYGIKSLYLGERDKNAKEFV
jgi:dTDP-4-dehydrorhamnose 3,5-epimerase